MPVVVADRGDFSVMQGSLSPQLLQWLQTDPYWADIMDRFGDQSYPKRSRRLFAEGGYTTGDCKPHVCSAPCAVDYSSKPLGAKRVAAFAREFRRVHREWLQDLGERCRGCVRGMLADVLVCPYLDHYFDFLT